MDWKPVKAIAFDLDYTLIDSGAGIVHCFNEARKRAGESVVEPGLIMKRIGLPIEETFRLFGSADPPAMREVFRKIAREGAMAERSFLLPGVAETLPRIREKGYRLAVNSTKSRPEIEAILSHLQVKDLFEVFVGSDEVKDAKPAPESLRLVIKRMKISPEKLVYVGDHVVDIRAARAAGVHIVAVKGGPCPVKDLEKEKPDVLLDNVSQLLAVLK